MSVKRMKPPKDEDESAEDETHESEGEESVSEGGEVDGHYKKKRNSNNDEDVEGGARGDKTKGAASDEEDEEEGLIEIPDGKGIPLGEIPRIGENIEKTDCEHLVPLHKVLFNRVEKKEISKQNIKEFNGFDFHPQSFQYFTKRGVLLGFKLRVLRNLCAFLDLKVAKEREDLVENILDFLMNPKASKEREKGRRWSDASGAKRGGMGYRGGKRESSVEQETTDDDDGDNNDNEEENSEMGGSEEKGNDECGQEGEDDDRHGEILHRREEIRKYKGGGSKKCSSKTSNSNRKEKKQERRRSNGSTVEDCFGERIREEERRRETCDKSEEGYAGTERENEDNGEIEKDNNKKGKGRGRNSWENIERKRKMSSEDGPPRKKSKKGPSNTDIRKFLKEFLEGADLDETPMNIILQKLNEQYPGIDLSEKKEFIKENVIFFVRSIRERNILSKSFQDKQ